MIQRIKACLNGGRPFPASPAELAAEAVAAVAAGAEALHVHPRDAAGKESLAAADIGAALIAIREAVPGVRVGVSTGLWISGGDVRRRAGLIAGWRELPDFASVNAGEEGFADLVRLLASQGVGVEAGVWRPEEAGAVLRQPLERVLIEVIDTPAAAAVPAADAILARLDEVGYRGERLLHGEEDACWPLIEHAGRLGLPTRVGLEDTLTLPGGAPAEGNAALVTHALRLWGG
ncbi:3-keto-5-aminohexanoate cleavage protein [Actinoplanes sp. NPDC026619]|uniref:3-keto-5-aminohexanoate cleavage protein n=1 Tax=Actinoplanes sp. NPDC026619 TaxID=3155798 RepID=UPI0033F4B331